MRPAKRDQTPFNGMLGVLNACRCPQALRRDGAYGGKCIFDPVVQFFQDEFLQFIGSFTFLGVDARLGQQNLCVDTRLFKQQAETVVFSRQEFIGGMIVRRPRRTMASSFNGAGPCHKP